MVEHRLADRLRRRTDFTHGFAKTVGSYRISSDAAPTSNPSELSRYTGKIAVISAGPPAMPPIVTGEYSPVNR